MMNHAIVIEENWAKPSHLSEFVGLFSVLVVLDAYIRMIGLWFQCHSHTPMICHQLWSFWANLDHRWTSSKVSSCGTIWTASGFMPKTSVKIVWHQSKVMLTSSATALIVIRRLSKIIFFTLQCFHRLLTCSGDQDEHLLGLT